MITAKQGLEPLPCHRAMTAEILLRCLEEVKPQADERQLCCREIALQFDLLLFYYANPQKRVPWDQHLGVEYARILRTAASLMYDMRDEPVLHDRASVTRDEWMRTRKCLDVAASDLEDYAGDPKKETRPPDVLKSMCAMYALLLVQKFSAHPPTLTAGGALYELASVLYEAVTGESDVSLEWHCRTSVAMRDGRRRR